MITQQIKQYSALNEWFQRPLGIAVANEFTNQLQTVIHYLRGEALLQLGNCGNNRWLTDLNFNYKWIASPIASDKRINLMCSFNQIPFNRSSMDCVLAPLTMEPFDNSLSLIDEIDRILKPMGFVIFLSLNPWSLWGAAMKCGLLSCFADNKIKMRTPFSLNRIFLQRGYRQCSLNNFCYIPPVTNASILKKLTFFDEIGKMIWPFPSGFYCYIAQKYEYINPSLIGYSVVPNTVKDYKSPLLARFN